MIGERTPLIAGNWKMNLGIRESQNLVEALLASEVPLDRDVIVCPTFTALHPVARILGTHRIKLGAQDVYWEKNGAFTGEISAEILRDVGCTYCIVGHSERRLKLGETDDSVNRKVRVLLEYGITPIMCCGETLMEHTSGETLDVVRMQVKRGLAHLEPVEASKVVVAYEPIWAIGTGQSDTPANANATVGSIRGELDHLFGAEVGGVMRILYGGSVNASNIDSFMSQPEIDGGLVGGASLKADAFSRIIHFVQQGVPAS